MTKAYSTLAIKSVTETDDERIITGIATTPSTDRDDDILEPTGAKFALPIPLLWQHNHNQPIGEVISATVTDKGIEIVAKIAKIADDGKLKERIDEAWQSIKSGLVKCLSVGFKIKEYNYLESSWGLHIKEWEWYELSVVTVPANSDAVITSVKQIKDAFSLPLQPTPNPPINPIAPPPTQATITKATPSNGAVALILPTNGVKLV
ncbi:HK97 family phage prohead protease [Moraxella bovis]|uniref:HK97 family phage prohead protease n=1 Tax=Moraxella bovis TaxID=476 RepID=UPI00227B8775|nr:HK97 family phage prohead protease [Moraxella bovis]WAJ74565.1 HK97 family phage prohead protease [Moraxella bovis]WAJ74818.1 HK97 family phage prohead protease [Moraxella bovis]